MTFNKYILLILLVATSCAKKAITPTGKIIGACTADSFTGTTLPSVGSPVAGNNVMSVTVNGAQCGAHQYANQPCVSVTLCSPANPANCQTINNILLDTGSYGLRIFNSVITVPLTPITKGDKALGECVQFGDGSSEWGPVEYAYVQLGNEPKVAVPIVAINSDFQSAPAPCTSSQSNPDVSPALSGFNGVLGVGLFSTDCGSACANISTNDQYFTCENNNCSCGATADLLAQVTNPISALPTDNNGLILKLPAVASGGVANLSGSLYLGVDTQANNASTGTTTTLTADGYAEVRSKFGAFSSTKLVSIIDSGSSVLFIPSIAALPDCGVIGNTDFSGFFCPASQQNLSSINYNSAGAADSTVNFSVENAHSLFQTGNMVFSTMAASSGTDTSAMMDWGLPFFYGKNVIVGIQGKASGLATGPYFAY
jgi:hypothetical protein